jgi:hypothetical protein
VEVIGHDIIRVVVWLAERFWVLGSALNFVVIDPVIALEKGTSTGREGSRDVEEPVPPGKVPFVVIRVVSNLTESDKSLFLRVA